MINDRKLKNSDILQVVQIFDMDGAYIPDAAIISVQHMHLTIQQLI